jgi:conjugative relaxase-like TrwC/TraI family protein
MLIVKSASPGSVKYYFDGRDPGVWSDGAARLLDLSGAVDPDDLRRVLEGRHPRTSQFLPRRTSARRRAGWDLIWASPKSFSLLAIQDPDPASSAVDAHRSAVAALIAHLDEGLGAARSGAPGGRAPCDGLIAAAFTHRYNSAGEPHVHTHLIVANLSRAQDRWSAVMSDQWYVDRRALSALYHLELRHQMALRGWNIEWRIRPDGLADVAEVGRSAVRAASSQTRAVEAFGAFEARRRAQTVPWQARVAAASPADRPVPFPLDSSRGAQAASASRQDPNPRSLAEPARVGAHLDDGRLHRAVETNLAVKRSDFRRADVLVALAATHPGGASVDAATAWVDAFCAASLPVTSTTSRPRWSTSLALQADRRLVEMLEEGWELRQSLPLPEIHSARDGSPNSGDSGGHVQEPSRFADPVLRFTCPPGESRLVEHSEVIYLHGRNLEAHGLRVALDTPSSGSATRWAVLASTTTYRRGESFDALFVDQADRRSSAELLLIAGEARRQKAQLILVEGGTLPRLANPASRGLQESPTRTVDVPAAQPWACSPTREAGPVDGSPALEPIGRRHATTVLDRWKALSELGVDAVMVGLGVEETAALNAAALAERSGGRTTDWGGSRQASRAPAWSQGDRVVMLSSRDRQVPFGTRGTVVAAGSRLGDTSVRWEAGNGSSAQALSTQDRIGYAYAVTPAVAARTSGGLVVLGPPEALPGMQGRVIDSALPEGHMATSRQIGRWPNRDLARGSTLGRDDLGLGF